MDVKGLKIEIYVNIDDPLDVAKVAAQTAKFVKSVDNAELTIFDFEVFEQDDPAAAEIDLKTELTSEGEDNG